MSVLPLATLAAVTGNDAYPAAYDVRPPDAARPAAPPAAPATPVVRARLLKRSMRGQPAAVRELTALFYPSVFRIAAGLTGRVDLARAVGRLVAQLGAELNHDTRGGRRTDLVFPV